MDGNESDGECRTCVDLTWPLDDGIVVVVDLTRDVPESVKKSWGRGRASPEEIFVKTLLVPRPLRSELGDAASDGLVMMFTEAHRIATESFERRLVEETSKLRLDMADMKFELVKWNFLFWIGQLAALTGILGFMLRNVR